MNIQALHARASGLLLYAAFIAAMLCPAVPAFAATPAADDDLIFIHHSSGGHWLLHSLRQALLDKDYIDEINEINYEYDVSPDPGRPDSLTYEGLLAGDHTDMCHWVRWFNDYLGTVKAFGSATGANRIIMFKSCYPNNNIGPDGPGGYPFDAPNRMMNDYKAVFRHPDGPGGTYSYNGRAYKPLEDIFAENPDVLFIYVTSPPLLPASTSPENAERARQFNAWVATEWLQSYAAAHPGLNNVVVFDWFDLLAVPEGQPNASTLRSDYATGPADNHPNDAANGRSTQVFAAGPSNVIDRAWSRFIGSAPPPPPASSSAVAVFPNPYRPGSGGNFDNTSQGKGIVFSGLKARSRIRIFTVAGELVRDIDPAGNGETCLWDASNGDGAPVASGVYLYLVTEPGSSDTIEGTLAIIR